MVEPTLEKNDLRERRWPWLVVLAITVAWQGWLTLGLVGNDCHAWLDDRPVVSGFHPQHVYLGWLGAQAWKNHGGSCAYDTAFQTGYLKTPVFNACRWGELFLFLGGATYQPAAYKLGLGVACLLTPLLILLAARAAGLTWLGGAAAVAIGLFVWWGPLGRQALEAGDLDLFLASVAVLAHVGLLIGFDRRPGVFIWLGLLATGCLGWFCQPLLFPIALPLLLMYYLSVGARHSSLAWHAGLWTAQAAGLAINLPWLMDWVSFWWLRAPPMDSTALLPHRTFRTLWEAPLWGGQIDRALAIIVLVSAGLGAILLTQRRQTAAASLLGLGSLLLALLAILGITWAPLGDMGTSALLAPALWFAALPAAHAWSQLALALYRRAAWGRSILAGLAASLFFAGIYAAQEVTALAERVISVAPLEVGLGPEREAIVRSLMENTQADARILWEDVKRGRSSSRWSALLPLLSGRAFIGGLDSEGLIEHARIGFQGEHLDGKLLASWSDQELSEYCERYNIGWVVCWSPAAIERFRAWPNAEYAIPLTDVGPGYLFAIKRNRRTFTLKGQAQLLQADSNRIILADVVPDQGIVVLSLHYQKGLRASPNRVQVEPEPCGSNRLDFIRLRVAGPVARVSLTWER